MENREIGTDFRGMGWNIGCGEEEEE